MLNNYKHLIPASRLSAVEAVLQSLFHDTAIDHIELLSGGLSGSTVYKMVVNAKAYVLKLDKPEDRFASIRSEILNQTAEAGVAPPLYYYNEEDGISVTGFVSSQPIRAAMKPDQIIEKLGKNIRLLHSLSCKANSQDMLGTVDGLISEFQQSEILSGWIIDDVLVGYGKIRPVYPWRDMHKVLSHNDLNPGNIICDGKRLWLIDWDAASLNDRFVDLAAAANFFVHTEEQERLLLQVYFEREPTPVEKGRFFLMRQVSRLIYGMLLAGVAARAKPANHLHDQEVESCTLSRFSKLIKAGKISMNTYEGQWFYAKANFNEALHGMRSSRFEESLCLMVGFDDKGQNVTVASK